MMRSVVYTDLGCRQTCYKPVFRKSTSKNDLTLDNLDLEDIQVNSLLRETRSQETLQHCKHSRTRKTAVVV